MDDNLLLERSAEWLIGLLRGPSYTYKSGAKDMGSMPSSEMDKIIIYLMHLVK